MDNIITNIFEHSNHKFNESVDLRLFSLIGRFNYWLVISCDDLTTVLEDQINLFLKAKEIIGEPQFDKNANLLILYKVNSLDQIDRESLLQIEEDLYHFKKSIIYYTGQELENLKTNLNNSTLIEDIESMILNEKVFEQHKESFDNNDYQSLLYRIAHKIPFLRINVKRINNLESLEEINKKSIIDNTLNDLLETKFFTITDEDLTALNDESILQTLITILPNED